MKRITTTILCLLLLICFTFPVWGSATVEQNTACAPQIVSRTETALSNSITVIDTIFLHSTTRSTKTASKQREFQINGTTAAIITIQGTFYYNGNTVSVTSKSVTQTDTYNGWSYSQTSFTSSGGTITLNARLTKLLIITRDITLSLSCDKNGNIS